MGGGEDGGGGSKVVGIVREGVAMGWVRALAVERGCREVRIGEGILEGDRS